MQHYKLNRLGDDLFSFTSPLGRHTIRASWEDAQKIRKRIRERHMVRADQGGAEAEILKTHFSTREQPRA